MILNLIKSNPKERRKWNIDEPVLKISELFCNTIQGENKVGIPSTFIRLQNCTLNCVWCDTISVWRFGNGYNLNEILNMLEENDMIEKYKGGQHIIWTGGSPLIQQKSIILFTKMFIERFGFKPYMEIENECVLMPDDEMISIIDCWNNSPKLSNSLNDDDMRYKPDVLKFLSELDNSHFKFVIQDEDDWLEIKRDFIDNGLIKREQIVIMPEGQTREELQNHYEQALNICIRENLRFTDRLHITIWDKKTGV
jgi:7-carboxy-7-deazaguanine synthase